MTWTSRTITGTYYGVTYGNGIFVAVGDSVASTSTDGVTWTSRTIPAGLYRAVAWDGTNFVAVGNAVCATSPDGTTWTSRTITGNLWGLETDTAGSILVAVGSSACRTSADHGLTWSTRTIPAGDYFALAHNGFRFAAVGADLAAYSNDGITWAAATVASGTWIAATAFERVFVALRDGRSVTSLDGATWADGGPLGMAGGLGVASNGFFAVAVGTDVAFRSMQV